MSGRVGERLQGRIVRLDEHGLALGLAAAIKAHLEAAGDEGVVRAYVCEGQDLSLGFCVRVPRPRSAISSPKRTTMTAKAATQWWAASRVGAPAPWPRGCHAKAVTAAHLAMSASTRPAGSSVI